MPQICDMGQTAYKQRVQKNKTLKSTVLFQAEAKGST
jgi:hypothetical protein